MDAAELKTMRAKLRMSQPALADALGVSRASIARYEAGTHTIPDSVSTACAHFIEQVSVTGPTGTEYHTYRLRTLQAGAGPYFDEVIDVEAFLDAAIDEYRRRAPDPFALTRLIEAADKALAVLAKIVRAGTRKAGQPQLRD